MSYIVISYILALKTIPSTPFLIMEPLSTIKPVMEIMGLKYKPNQHLINYYSRNLVISIPLFVLLFPLLAYFIVNLNNLSKATDVTYVIAADLMCIGQYWFLVAQKLPLQKLMSELQWIVQQSMF